MEEVIVRDFMSNAQRSEKILTQEEVPFKQVLLVQNLQAVEGSKFCGASMEGRAIAKELTKNMTWPMNTNYNLSAAEKALRKSVEECENSGGKLTLPTSIDNSKLFNNGRRFRFFVPRRLAEYCEDPEKKSYINARVFLGMFVGLRNKSLSIALVPVERDSSANNEKLCSDSEWEIEDNAAVVLASDAESALEEEASTSRKRKLVVTTKRKGEKSFRASEL